MALTPHEVETEGLKVKLRYALVPRPPQDEPSKRWLLDGPPPGMDLDTFKKIQALNAVLAAARRRRKALSARDRLFALAAKRLPM